MGGCVGMEGGYGGGGGWGKMDQYVDHAGYPPLQHAPSLDPSQYQIHR